MRYLSIFAHMAGAIEATKAESYAILMILAYICYRALTSAFRRASLAAPQIA